MNHYVYEITNNINGKKYIGKRSCKCSIEKDSYMGSGWLLKKAQQKYGINNFKKTILKVCDSQEDAYKEEERLIAQYDATNDEMYYNIANGGLGGRKGLKKQLPFETVTNIFTGEKVNVLELINSSEDLFYIDDTGRKVYNLNMFKMNTMLCNGMMGIKVSERFKNKEIYVLDGIYENNPSAELILCFKNIAKAQEKDFCGGHMGLKTIKRMDEYDRYIADKYNSENDDDYDDNEFKYYNDGYLAYLEHK